MSDCGRIVELLYGPLQRLDSDVYAYFWTKGDKKSQWFDVRKTPIEALKADAARLAVSDDVYLSCCASDTKGSRDKRMSLESKDEHGNITPSPAWMMALYMDVDTLEDPEKMRKNARVPASVADAVRDLLTLDIPPSVLIGSGHGVHAWWLLKEPLSIIGDIELYDNISKAFRRCVIAELEAQGLPYSGLDSASDLCRVLRIDGTINHKDGGKLPVQLLHESDTRYTMADFRQLVDPYIKEHPEEFSDLFPETASAPTSTKGEVMRNDAGRVADGTLTDEQIHTRLEKARASRTPKDGITRGEAFRRLFDQGTGAGIPWLKDPNDDSAVDEALFELVAFWMGGDAAAVKKAVMQSARVRDKWTARDHRTYLDDSIKKAINYCTAFYVEPAPVTRRETLTIELLAEEMKRRGIVVNFDVIRKRLDVTIDGSMYSPETGKPYGKESLVTRLFSDLRTLYKGADCQTLRLFLDEIIRDSEYNPVMNWLESLPVWDRKTDYLKRLYALMGIDGADPDAELSRVLVRKWLLQAVGQLYSRLDAPIQPEGVLVLQGGEGIGKTSLLMRLAVRPEWCKDGLHIDFGDKDTVRRACSYWLAELGEVDSTMKADVAALKAFITMNVDEYRRSYGREDEHWPRLTTLAASVNDAGYLVDDSANINRRWWTVPLTKVMPYSEIQSFDAKGLWVQIMALYRKGETWRLTADEKAALGRRNDKHRKGGKGADEVLDVLSRAKEHPTEYVYREMSATEWKDGYSVLSRFDSKVIGTALQHMDVESRILHGRKLYKLPVRRIY